MGIFFFSLKIRGVKCGSSVCGRSLICDLTVPHPPLSLIKTGSEISCLPGSSSYPPHPEQFPPDSSNLQHHESSGCCRLRRSSAKQMSLVFLCLCELKKTKNKTIYLHIQSPGNRSDSHACTKMCIRKNVFWRIITFKMLCCYQAVLSSRVVFFNPKMRLKSTVSMFMW